METQGMKRSHRPRRMLLIICAIALSSGGMALLCGCQENLFSDSDATTRSRIDRYYNRDSATETSESRKRGSDLGFGIPSGGPSY
jgi:hypothetical protein